MCVLFVFRRPILISVGQNLVSQTELKPADVIVVLGGGETLRADHAARLFRENLAPRILVMVPQSLPEGTPYRDILSMERRLVDAVFGFHQIPTAVVEWTKRPVFSTYEETLLLKEWMTANTKQSAIVVTGYFQSSRAHWTLERSLVDTDIQIQVAPAPQPAIDAENWWTDVEGILDVQNEYIKYSYYRLRGLLGRE